MPASVPVAEGSKTAASAMLRGAHAANSGAYHKPFVPRGASKALKDKTEPPPPTFTAACRGVSRPPKAPS